MDPEQPPKSYRDLTPTSIHLLTRILSHQPPPTSSQLPHYTSLTLSQIRSLPSHLLRNAHTSTHIHEPISALFRRFSARGNRPPNHTRNGEASPQLCAMHSNLPHRLLRVLYKVLRHEMSRGIPHSLRNIEHLHPEVPKILDALRTASTVFLSPDEFIERWGVLPPTEEALRSRDAGRWVREGGCAACILARLGGDTQVCVALRTGILVRLGAKRGACGRLKWVEGWISEMENAEELIRDSDSLAREIRRLKRDERKGRTTEEGGMGEQATGQEDLSGVEYTEEELAQMNENVEKWREGVAPQEEQKAPPPSMPMKWTASQYTPSVYSQATGFGPREPYVPPRSQWKRTRKSSVSGVSDFSFERSDDEAGGQPPSAPI